LKRGAVPQVIRFEIYADEPGRALEFYARIFGMGDGEMGDGRTGDWRTGERREWRIPGVGLVTCELDENGQLYGLFRSEDALERDEIAVGTRCCAAAA
jgi:hypothetical protein